MPGIIFSGFLVLALGESYTFPRASNTIWVSSPTFAETQVKDGSLIVKAKTEGAFYISGLRGFLDPQKIVVIDAQNFLALKKCPEAPLKFSESTRLELGHYSLENLKSLRDCGFQKIRLGKDDQRLSESLFLTREAAAREKGLNFSHSFFEKGLRVLTFSQPQPSLSQAQISLDDLYPFYELRGREGPRPGRTLIFHLTLFEFSRAKAQALGVTLPTQMQLNNLQGPKALGIGVDFGEALGIGKILAQPQIRTKPGEKATFQSGGEIPIPQRSLSSAQTLWKNYGLLIELEPDAQLRSGDPEISLRFKAEFSEPDQGLSIGGVPGMLTRRLESNFDLRCDEETVLSTLLQSRRGQNRRGLAALTQIPLLGRLFSNEQNNEQSSELWFALRPSWEEIKVSSEWTKKTL